MQRRYLLFDAWNQITKTRLEQIRKVKKLNPEESLKYKKKNVTKTDVALFYSATTEEDLSKIILSNVLRLK